MSQQPSLFSSEPVAEAVALPQVPIAPSSSVTAKHCSSMGAQQAETTREALWQRMLALYATGPKTDAEIARAVSTRTRTVAPSTISARRQELITQRLVEDAKDTRKNPATNVSNSLWKLIGT